MYIYETSYAPKLYKHTLLGVYTNRFKSVYCRHWGWGMRGAFLLYFSPSMGGCPNAMSCFLNQEWRQRHRMAQKHPGWVHQLLNSAPRTLRDDSYCQLPLLLLIAVAQKRHPHHERDKLQRFMTRKILFCSALETFFKGNEFMQCVGTHKENDPFGGEKGFLRVILWLCLILCCNSAPHMCVC